MAKKIYYIYTFLFLFSGDLLKAQHFFLPLSNESELKYSPWLNKVNSPTHTSIRPFLSKDLFRDTPYDSLNNIQLPDKKFYKSWFGRKLLKEHFLQVNEDDVRIWLDPAVEVSSGRNLEADTAQNFFMNTRGFWLQGTVGKRFSFEASFYENLGHFPYYLDSAIKKSRIVPGQGRIKQRKSNMDFATATGTISYQLDKHFTFQFGNDRNFIGDGYRTLLLSDNTFPYPFLKVISDIWKVRYINLFTVLQDLELTKLNDDKAYRRKYGSFHYLDINIGKHATLGLFEAVIWKSDSITGHRGFDINYLNPFVFLRPIEFGIGSPDNVLLGLNAKIKINSSISLYGQVMLDEFLLNEVKAGNGWWGNKQAVLGGFKYFNVFGVKNLHLQSEASYVRPYTYQHREPLGNYGHYRQSLAHPLGANFYESVSFIYYQYKRLNVKARLSYAVVGYDTDSVNHGQNIFRSYEINLYSEYGNEVGQGLRTTLTVGQLTLSYTINPAYNFRFFIDVFNRQSKNTKQTLNTLTVQAGVKTCLFNRYYDF